MNLNLAGGWPWIVGSVAVCALVIQQSVRFSRRLIKHIERMTMDMKLIQDLSLEVSQFLDISRLLPVIMMAFKRASRSEKGSLMLIDEATGDLVIKASVGLPDSVVREARFKMGEGIAGYVAATGRPLLVEDISQSPLYKDLPSIGPVRPKETFLCLPLLYKGKTLGAVSLHNRITGKPFIRNDEVLFSILANQAAVAITNARSYEAAVRDPETYLYTASHFERRLLEELQRVAVHKLPLSMIIMSPDGYAHYRQTLGEQKTDLLLAEIARRVRRHVRLGDLPARVQEAEFAVLMPDTDTDPAREVADRLHRLQEESPIEVGGVPITAKLAIGVTTLSFAEAKEHAVTPQALLDRARKAVTSTA